MKWLNELIKNHISEIVFFLLLFSLVLLFYGNYLGLYFSQDDFFHLSVSQTDGTLKAFLNLFSFRNFSDRGGIYFYRPMFREAIFNIYYSKFGLNALPFRITQFVVHFINIILTYVISIKVTKNRRIAYIASAFFGIATPNIGILSYLAGGIQMSGMLMFALLSLIFYQKHLEKDSKKHKLLSFVFFLFALGSHETAVTLPLVNIGLHLLRNKLSIKNIFSALMDNIFFFLPVVILLYLEIFMIGLPTSEQQYRLAISFKKIINSYFWYFAWALGIPEMLVDFVGPGIKLNSDLMKYWGSFFIIIFSSFSIMTVFVFSTLLKVYKSKVFIFALLWAVIGIAPVVLLPFHREYYYLGFILPPLGIITGFVFNELNIKNKILSYVFVVIFLILSFTSIKLANTNYWSITRSKIAKLLVADLITKYPTLPTGAKIYFTNDRNQPYFNPEWGNSTKQASVIFSGSDALRLLYNDKSIKAYYEDLDASPSGELVFPIEAVVNK